MIGKRPKVALFVAVLVGLVALFLRPRTYVRDTFDSPGGQYHIVVLGKNSRLPLPAMPGQGGDGDGIVRLTDHQGRVLREIDVDAPINRVNIVNWQPRGVDVKLVVDWPLDPPDGPAPR